MSARSQLLLVGGMGMMAFTIWGAAPILVDRIRASRAQPPTADSAAAGDASASS